MASAVAISASRALGLVIYKCKLNGGLPFKCFTKLYDSLVWPIIEYGSSIWGATKRHVSRLYKIVHATTI